MKYAMLLAIIFLACTRTLTPPSIDSDELVSNSSSSYESPLLDSLLATVEITPDSVFNLYFKNGDANKQVLAKASICLANMNGMMKGESFTGRISTPIAITAMDGSFIRNGYISEIF